MKFSKKTKSQYFCFEIYDPDMKEMAVSELVEDFIPFCLICHDKDDKKIHWHGMLDYGGRTTLNWILEAYGHLFANGYAQPVTRPENYYKYMYHDQSIEKAKGKHVYSENEFEFHNGFDPGNLHNYTETEKGLLMDGIMSVANEEKIYEYAGLLEKLSNDSRELYYFAMNNTILVNGYMASHRNRNKGKKGNNDYNC